jgi:hypothetical protein
VVVDMAVPPLGVVELDSAVSQPSFCTRKPPARVMGGAGLLVTSERVIRESDWGKVRGR